MLDFLKFSVDRKDRKRITEVYPEFKVCRTKDLMIRGSDFYAIWDEENGLWSKDTFRAIEIIDNYILEECKKREEYDDGYKIVPMLLSNSKAGSIDAWNKYCTKQMPDIYKQLDENLAFSNDEIKKTDYVSMRMPYPLEEGSTEAWDELMGTLYSVSEKRKIEWAIGSILSGDSKKIQKLYIFYGGPGTGKSTVLNIIERIFYGHTCVFDAKALGSSNASFALEAFSSNPLVAIQHDGDLSRIEDNTRLNSLVSHEVMVVNEKFKSQYETSFNSTLFMGTNKPVKITDAKSGLLRRMIDINPTGDKVSMTKYQRLYNRIGFELGGIAWKCLQVYKEDPLYYDKYVPIFMMSASNTFYNFMLDNYITFKEQEKITLKQAWALYNEFVSEAKITYSMNQVDFKNELKEYFKTFKERDRVDGAQAWNVYSEFRTEKFSMSTTNPEAKENGLIFEEQESLLDRELGTCLAQEATEDGIPSCKWSNCKTKLYSIDTKKLHYVKPPENHIVIDFDLKNSEGEKSYKKNLEAANKWPPTYAELSKSGAGIHLHYIYDGDVTKLAPVYAEDIEVKVFTGGSSLRRKLTKCNRIPIAHINTNLPLKGEEKKVINSDSIKSEKGLRQLIERNLRKEIHASTNQSVNFIFSILEECYANGLKYDVTDMRPAIMSFAAKSTNHSAECLRLVSKMKFKSEEISSGDTYISKDKTIVFYDVEVFPNLFVVVWKFEGEGKPFVKMINPSPADVEELMKMKLVGYNCRRYDNHILYARMMGYSNEELFKLSQRIINSKKGENSNCFFGEAYNVSYTDIYDFSSKKQSLKKFEIELGIHHQELGLPWDKPVPEELWTKVADYCTNDVIATEATWNARKGDFLAREILADLAGMTVNDTTNSLTTRIIFGKERQPQSEFRYRNLAEPVKSIDPEMRNFIFSKTVMDGDFDKESILPYFPGYKFDKTKPKGTESTYMGEIVGEGGYVYSDPGAYSYAKCYDVASEHPHAITSEYMFGRYTENFNDLMEARVAIKHGDYEKAGMLFGGKLKKYLTDKDSAKALAGALKIAINSVYGLTAASFMNPFHDIRNVDNIVAKRGALFMITLKNAVLRKGYKVLHCKTDSIKVLNPDDEIEKFIFDFGKKYGYTFEIESVFDRFCLVNDAVYISHHRYDDPEEPGKWSATGAEFAVPYIFKTLFTHEPLEFKDFCETKSATTDLYLDMNENLPEGEHNYHFVGKAGLFCPIKPGLGGGILYRKNKEGDGYSSVAGTKGYRWLESEVVEQFGKQDDIDISFYDDLASKAKEHISEYCEFDSFTDISRDLIPIYDFMNVPENCEDGIPF